MHRFSLVAESRVYSLLWCVGFSLVWLLLLQSSLLLKWQRICLQCRRLGFDLWVGKILWRREWQSTPVFLPGESHGQRSLAGYSPYGHKESDTTELLPLLL